MLLRFFSSISWRRLFLGLGLTLLLVLVGLALVLLLLPSLVSSPHLQPKWQAMASRVLQRPVSWTRLDMTWSSLLIDELRLGPGAAPLLAVEVDAIEVVYGLGRGDQQRLTLELGVRVQGVHAELALPPATGAAQPATVDPLTALAQALQQVAELSWPLPLDVRLAVAVAPVTVEVRGVGGHTLQVDDGALRVAVPSLASRPVELVLSGQLRADARDLGRCALLAEVGNLVTPLQRIRPADAMLSVDLSAPGVVGALRGSLRRDEGLSGHVELALADLVQGLAPLLPSNLPAPSGMVRSDWHADIDAANDLQLRLTVQGRDLAISGGSLPGALGPVTMNFSQQIATDHRRQLVSFNDGRLQVDGLLRAEWRATVTQPTSAQRKLQATLGPLRVDLARAWQLARPLFPPAVPQIDLRGSATLQAAQLTVQGPENSGTLVIQGAALTVPGLAMALPAGKLGLTALHLTLEQAEAPLAAFKPTALDAAVHWGVADLQWRADQAVTVRQLAGESRVALRDIAWLPTAARKVTARMQLDESLSLAAATVAGLVNIGDLRQSLQVQAGLTADGTLQASVPQLQLDCSHMQVQAGSRLLTLPAVRARAALAELRWPLQGLSGLTLASAEGNVTLGQLLALRGNVQLEAGTPQRLEHRGTLHVELEPTLTLLAPLLPAGLAAGGALDSVWQIRLPLPTGVPQLTGNPLQRARLALALLDSAELRTDLQLRQLRLPLAGSTLTLATLQTTSPLQLQLRQHGDVLQAGGALRLAGYAGLPAALAQLPAQTVTVSGALELHRWERLWLQQQLQLAPWAVREVAEVNVERLATLLTAPQLPSAAEVLRRLEVVALADVAADFPSPAIEVLPGLRIGGRLATGGRLDLDPGRTLSLRGYAQSRQFGVSLGTTRIDGLDAELGFGRTLDLRFSGSAPPAAQPLSEGLLHPSPLPAAPALDLLARVRNDWQRYTADSDGIRLQRLALQPAGLSLQATNLTASLRLAEDGLGLDTLQTELLGGTVRASGLLDLQPELPTLRASAAFSQVQSARLLATASDDPASSAISGSVALTLPLAENQWRLLEGLQLQLELWQVGPRTLERALFALDPQERNEQLLAQRKLLRLGGLRNLRVRAADGNLSIDGEVQAGGVPLALPRLERLRLSDLPQQPQLDQVFTQLAAVRPVFALLRANTLNVGNDGRFSLERRAYDQP